jgi:hypothetical protein
LGSFTPSSGAAFSADGGIGIGVECNFMAADPGSQLAVAEQTWPVTNVTAYELYGTLAMRAADEADILARIWLDGRLIFNGNLKTPVGGPATENIWIYVAPAALKAPASQLKIHVEAAAAGAGWPVDCEIELGGRWQ